MGERKERHSEGKIQILCTEKWKQKNRATCIIKTEAESDEHC